MNVESVKEKVKSRGYWEIQLTPLNFDPSIITSREKCKEIVSQSSVELRGWSYPHVPRSSDKYQEIYYGSDFVESFVDWQIHKQVWRFWQSSMFVHYLGLWEDWWDEDTWRAPEEKDKLRPGEKLSVIGTVYTISEVFEFLKRLIAHGIFDDGVIVEISLKGIENRELVILDPGRVPLMGEYRSRIHEYNIPKLILSKQEILNGSKSLAVKMSSDIFEVFNWEKSRQPVHVFTEDQEKLLNRRL